MLRHICVGFFYFNLHLFLIIIIIIGSVSDGLQAVIGQAASLFVVFCVDVAWHPQVRWTHLSRQLRVQSDWLQCGSVSHLQLIKKIIIIIITVVNKRSVTTFKLHNCDQETGQLPNKISIHSN